MIILQVKIPVRFMFVLLGPPKADIDYHEVGRSISTLMSNTVTNQLNIEWYGLRYSEN